MEPRVSSIDEAFALVYEFGRYTAKERIPAGVPMVVFLDAGVVRVTFLDRFVDVSAGATHRAQVDPKHSEFLLNGKDSVTVHYAARGFAAGAS